MHALACDIRLAAAHASFALPEALWGGFPGAGGPVRLPGIVERGRALELICTGRQLDATEMERIGLVQTVYPGERLNNMATVDSDHEDEFNRWYNEEHLPDVRRRFPQITSARRYRATDGEDPRYLVVYEYNVASEDELNDLARADNSQRQELWKLYDEAMGSFAKRTRRCFWRIHP